MIQSLQRLNLIRPSLKLIYGHTGMSLYPKQCKLAIFKSQTSIFSTLFNSNFRLFDKTIELSTINATVFLPSNILFNEASLRGIWLSFDHCSFYSPSFELPQITDSVVLTTNLLVSVNAEWKKYQDIEKAIIQRMKEERAAYDIVILAEMDEMENQKAEKKKKKRYSIKERVFIPPKVTENTIVEVTADFIEFEDQSFRNLRNSLGPNALNLDKNEINLRSNRILGGLYAINYLQRPSQAFEFVNNMNIRLEIQPNDLKFCEFNESDPEKLFEVTIHLPRDVCWWEEPHVCRWESVDENPDITRQSRIHSDVVKKDEKSVVKPKIINDFQLTNIPKSVNIYDLTVHDIVPRLPSDYKFAMEKMEELNELERARKFREQLQQEDEEEERAAKRAAFDKAVKELTMQHTDSHGSITEEGLNEIEMLTERLEEEEEKKMKAEEGDQKKRYRVEVIPRAARGLFPSPENKTRQIEIREQVTITSVEKQGTKLSELLDELKVQRESNFPKFKEAPPTEPEDPPPIIDELTPPPPPSTPIARNRMSISGGPKKRISEIHPMGHLSQRNSIQRTRRISRPLSHNDEEPTAASKKEKQKKQHANHVEKSTEAKLPKYLGRWSTNGIFGQTYNKLDGVLTFKAGRFGLGTFN